MDDLSTFIEIIILVNFSINMKYRCGLRWLNLITLLEHYWIRFTFMDWDVGLLMFCDLIGPHKNGIDLMTNERTSPFSNWLKILFYVGLIKLSSIYHGRAIYDSEIKPLCSSMYYEKVKIACMPYKSMWLLIYFYKIHISLQTP